MSGQAPTLNPGVGAIADIATYASGRNPYDTFRDRYSIPDRVFQAGQSKDAEAKWRMRKTFLKYLANKVGVSLVYNFRYDDVDSVKGELEKITGYPFVSNIVGRFLKVTDYGVREQLQQAKKEVSAENMAEIMKAADGINAILRGEKATQDQLNAIALHYNMLDRNMLTGLARKNGYVYLEEILKAKTNEEKIEALRIQGEIERRNKK